MFLTDTTSGKWTFSIFFLVCREHVFGFPNDAWSTVKKVRSLPEYISFYSKHDDNAEA